MAEKIDFKRVWKHLYNPPKTVPVVVDVPSLNFLMIDGQGDPNTSPLYQQSVSALYTLAYALKFAVKKQQGIDFAVMPLEGLWWVEDMRTFSVERKHEWLWTMMIVQPEYVSSELVESIRRETEAKKNMPLLEKLRFESYHEGLSVQIMHIGAYADEAPNIKRMHSFAIDQGYQLSGKHHEIYLGDPQRTDPKRLKTVLRQPIRKALD